MEIVVLGNCCSSCDATFKTVTKVAQEVNPSIVVKQEGDMVQILKYGILHTPAIVINGKVITSGYNPSEKEIKDILLQYCS